MADQRVAADERGHHCHGDGPRRHRAAGDKVVRGGLLPAGEVKADARDDGTINYDDEIIERAEGHGKKRGSRRTG
jgi:hypothetical protein